MRRHADLGAGVQALAEASDLEGRQELQCFEEKPIFACFRNELKPRFLFGKYLYEPLEDVPQWYIDLLLKWDDKPAKFYDILRKVRKMS